MKALAHNGRTSCGLQRQIMFSALTVITLLFAAPAQTRREQVEGVQNFGRVTDHYLRGGQITPVGVERLAAMGVRTIIDLRDKESPGEGEACERHGIKYFKFPMNGHEAPDNKVINEILTIIEKAREPVYVHCSAGKHRASTVAALYRMRVQGWSKEQAWAEQQSYGFGSAEEHPELYAYVYNGKSESDGRRVVQVAARTPNIDDDEKSSDSKKKKDKDSSKSKKKGKDKDDDNEESDKKSSSTRSSDKVKEQEKRQAIKTDTKPAPKAEEDTKVESANKVASASTGGRLSSDADYIPLADAVRRAKAEGGSGDVLKIDLEWDPARSVTTWDVTFSSGTEYEIDATSGKLLGTKAKTPAKLAVLTPLSLNGGSAKNLLTFQDIIRKAEASHKQSVTEMELKQIKGRTETIFEVVLADGTTLHYDAATGKVVVGN